MQMFEELPMQSNIEVALHVLKKVKIKIKKKIQKFAEIC
jgi:hypothetical protein